MQERRELPGIHVLRIAASLVIAAYHADMAGIAASYAPWLATLAGPRAVAPSVTSLFLTLSGFGLFYADATRSQSRARTAREFWRARASRLVPLMLVGHLLVAPFALTGASRYAPGEAAVRGLLVTTATQSWYPPYALSFDFPAWTLSVLAFGYLLYPWVAARVASLRPRAAAALLLGVWLASVAISRLILLGGDGPNDTVSVAHSFAHVFPPVRALEFVSGILLGRLWMATRGRFGGTWTLVALAPAPMLVVALAAGWFEPRPAGWLGYGGLMPLWWVLIWVISAVSLDPRQAGWSQRLGRASFAVYILHVAMLIPLDALLHRGWLGGFASAAVALWFALLVPVGLAAERWFVAPIARRLLPPRAQGQARAPAGPRKHGVPGGASPGTAWQSRVGAGDR